MEMTTRLKLQAGDTIQLLNLSNEEQKAEWMIESIVSEDISGICYRASCNSQGGWLQELYPAKLSPAAGEEDAHFMRDSEGQLFLQECAMEEKFVAMYDGIVRVHKMFNSVCRAHLNADILNRCVANCQILQGCPYDKSKHPSLYLWTPNQENKKTFATYLSEVRAHPGKKPIYKLYNILNTFIVLAEYMQVLHLEGLLHLNLTPSRILISYDSDFNIDVPSIALLNTLSLHLIDNSDPLFSGAAAYQAPEVSQGKAGIRSNLYSIGASLFKSIILVNKMPNDGIYSEEYYNYLDRLVTSSELINASAANSNIYLQSILSEILKKCLAHDATNRYEDCNALIADLQEARSLLLPVSDGLDVEEARRRLDDVDAEQEGISSPIAILQELLFKHPLPVAQWTPGNAHRHINVLVLGSGTFSQKFIDLCLEIGQIPGNKIHITAISDNPERDRAVYLQFRPALNQFVTVNGHLAHTSGESYAQLDFIPVPHATFKAFSCDDMDINKDILESFILERAIKHTCFQYIFISLGDDTLNQRLSEICVDATDILKNECQVAYVADRKNEGTLKGIPVCVTKRATEHNIDKELYRMALNIHLSWNGTLNVDMDEAINRFHERYNYESSLAFAFSIHYKLACLGIDNSDLFKAAAVFDEKMNGKGSNDLLATMAYFEHRRWVIEKLVDGWQAPLDSAGQIDYVQCLAIGRSMNKTNDIVRGLHPCIVRSTKETPLQEGTFTEKEWDNSKLDGLDELDSMSIRLHNVFRHEALEFKEAWPLDNGAFKEIREMILDADKSVVYAFKRFEMCLKRILEGSKEYSKQYSYYAAAFEDTFNNYPQDVQKKLQSCLQTLKQGFFPVIESNLYRDYKDNDTILIRKIPFILTYKTRPCLAMAFDDGRKHGGRNDDVFRNVASAMVLNPKQITYLYCFDSYSRTAFLMQKLKAVQNYIKSRRMALKIQLLIAIIASLDKKAEKRIEKLKEGVLKTGVENLKIIVVSSENEAINMLCEELSYVPVDFFDGATPLFSSHFYNSIVINKMAKKYPYFEFDSMNKKFKICMNCQHLTFIKDNSFIRVDDMFSLRQATDHTFNLPDYASDYEKLWAIYSGEWMTDDDSPYEHGIANWTRMCNILDQKDFVKISLSSADDHPTDPVICSLPHSCHKSVTYIIRQLVERGFIEANSKVDNIDSDTCRIIVYTRWAIKDKIKELFSRPEKLVDHCLIKVESDINESDSCIRINFDNLDVRSLDLANKDEWKYNKFVVPLLKKLNHEGFIRNLHWDDENEKTKRINFSYISPRIKQLLTKAGEILEIYVYYEALKTGFFDDISSGYEFQWEYGDIGNELDCVMTKGTRSLMVECKAKATIDQNAYHKFNNLAEQFGINCTKVIVANTYVPKFAAINKMQANRGKQMNIITISDMKDITHIGNILKDLMAGKN